VLIPTILCGGVGSRLWPVSRELHPKPFMQLQDGLSLVQKALIYAAQLPEVAQVAVVTNQDLFFKVQDEWSSIQTKMVRQTYVLEPVGRNTAAAVGTMAALLRMQYGPDTMMLVLAADHVIQDRVAFEAAVARARILAAQGQLVTFGIKPNQPETGYGYIQADGEKVLSFVEKPSLEKAIEYIDSGQYLWNAGMFCFQAGVILAELRQHAPDMIDAIDRCIAVSPSVSIPQGIKVVLDAGAFSKVPENSIDYAVMEKSERVSVVPCDIGWSDLGSWTALGDLMVRDDNGNQVDGETMLYDTKNTIVHSARRMVATLGLDNIAIVDTPDALLVADKTRLQEVKNIYANLKDQGHESYRTHQTVHRPWGTYTVLEEGLGFKIKRIEVKPGASLSLQMHRYRSEHWVVISGTAQVVNGERTLVLQANQSTYIPAGHKHRLENPGVDKVVIIEVQTGEYVGEDDIIRFEDIYGRANKVDMQSV
jgi:mannose-1-phosphate guanylyltransferase/mannose-6-phosphate isomerase